MFISPMLLESAKEPFNSDDYITETKFDGIRLIASRNNGLIRLYTRHNNEVTAKFPELLTLDIPDGTVLDGELIVPGSTGAKSAPFFVLSRLLNVKHRKQRLVWRLGLTIKHVRIERISFRLATDLYSRDNELTVEFHLLQASAKRVGRYSDRCRKLFLIEPPYMLRILFERILAKSVCFVMNERQHSVDQSDVRRLHFAINFLDLRGIEFDDVLAAEVTFEMIAFVHRVYAAFLPDNIMRSTGAQEIVEGHALFREL